MSFHNEIKKEVERVGYHLISTAPTKDENIKAVLASDEVKGEYVTWIYNVSIDGLFHGHYFTYYLDKSKKDEMLRKAFNDFESRRRN